MLCVKCGNEMKDFEQVCSKCGYNKNTISDNDNPFGVRNQGIYNPNAVNKEEAQEKLDHEKQFNELAEIYMGPAYYNFKKGTFSWCAFFLGALYIAYRKMLAVSVIVWAINIAILFIFHNNFYLYSGVSLIFALFLGLSFKKIYFNDSMEKVGNIKKSNPEKGYNQLVEIVKYRGGVSMLYPFLLLAVAFVVMSILYLSGIQLPEVKLPFAIPNINI